MPISQMSHASVSCFGTLLGSPVTFIGYMFLQNEKEKPEKMKIEEIARRFWISVQSSGEPKDEGDIQIKEYPYPYPYP